MAPFEAGPNTEIDDTQFGRILAKGALIGVPFTFVLSLLIALPGVGWLLAAGIAVWPALVGGPFFGGFAALMWAMKAHEPVHEHIASVTPLVTRAPTPASRSHAA